MAHLNKPNLYDIEDTNIALLGSDLEQRVREHAGDTESAWHEVGQEAGLQIWRIEDFHVVSWPKERYGSFYDGDSYIILHTYKKTPEANSFSYNLHFWLGRNTTQDEAGTAAYKSVELDDHLGGKPVQYREVEGFESPQFLSYFPRFYSMHGGVATGFRHITEPCPEDVKRLYRINLSRADGRSSLVVREVSPTADSLVEGDVYVLDKGRHILQFNAKGSAGQERFRAAELAQSLANERKGQAEVNVYEQDGPGASQFLSEFGTGTYLRKLEPINTDPHLSHQALYRLVDVAGTMVFQQMDTDSRENLSPSGVFLLDLSSHSSLPCIFIWIGSRVSSTQAQLGFHYGQRYLHDKKIKTGVNAVCVAIPIIKIREGNEPANFLEAL